MSQTESPAEAIVDLVPAKVKRKPRKPTTALNAVGFDEFSAHSDANDALDTLDATVPKVRRARRSKADDESVSLPTPASQTASQPVPTLTSTPKSPRSGASGPAVASIDLAIVETVPAAATLPAASAIAQPQQKQTAHPLIGKADPVRLSTAPRLHPDIVTLARSVRGGRTALLPALGDDAQLGMRLMSDTATPADPYCALVLHFPGGQIELGDGVRLLAALTGIDLGHSAVELPNTQWLHSAVIGRLGQTPLRDVTSILRGCLPPDLSDQAQRNAESNPESDSATDASTSMQTVCLTLRGQQHAFSMQARASAATWLDFIARTHWQREQLPINTFDDLPVRLPVLIATHALPFALLADITVGDVLLPDTVAFDCSGYGRLYWRGMQLKVEFAAPATLTILTLESRMEPYDAADDDVLIHAVPTTSLAHTSNALDGVPVQLQFEMGRCHTTLACLRTLAAGTVLPIEGGSPSAIAVIANGRQLGRGELVDVNGQLGIRIVHWAA